MALGGLARIPFCYDQASGRMFGLTPEAIRLLETLVNRTGGAGETIDAFDAVAPTSTKGDLIVHNGTKNVRQGAGTSGTFVRYDSSSPTGVTAGHAVTSVGLASTSSALTVSGGAITSTGAFELSLAADLEEIAALSAYGLVARTADAVWEVRALTVNPAHLDLTDGDGVAGDPYIEFAAGAIDELLPAQVVGGFLKSDGATTSFATIEAGDLPAKPSFSVNKNGVNQTAVPADTWTKVTFSMAEWDTTADGFDFTDDRFVPPPGLGRFTWNITLAGAEDQAVYVAALYKNGSRYKDGQRIEASGTGGISSAGSVLAEGDGTDYYELWVYQNTDPGGADQIVSGSVFSTYFEWIWESN